MSSNARLKRPSLGDTNLNSEMKSWRKNKMEERKLALQNDVVDKYMATTRKSHKQAQLLVHRDFDDKFTKKTPSADEYLEKSQAKYAVWKERERERLDRRYRSLNKSYMSAYKKLGLENYVPKSRKTSTSETRGGSVNDVAVNVDNTNSVDFSEPFDNDEPMSEQDALLALGKLNIEASQRRFSDCTGVEKHPNSRRRCSTGSINLEDFAKLRLMHIALTSVTEDANQAEGSDEETEKDDTLAELSDVTARRTSLAATIKDEEVEDISAEDLIVKPKRRASIAALPKATTKHDIISVNRRLDRRPTLPNIAIPFNYGN